MPELHFKGKEFVYNHHLSVPFRPLEPDTDKSIGDGGLDDNLIIHGDNLHALKALLPMYAGKVDCVFIDPPYNTGNESWSYNDNVNSPMIREWLDSNPVTIEDGLRHDKWLSMMWPRLRLLYELLSEEGSIWITLDDNEVHRAREVLDEIFGQDNLLAGAIWEKADSPRMDADYFSTSHDYLLAYAKDKSQVIFNRIGSEDDEPAEHYNLTDDSGRRYYLKPLRAMGGQGETREARPNLHYPLTAPDGTKVLPKLQNGRDGAWRWSSEKVQREHHRIEWRKGRRGWAPYFRIYADLGDGTPPETIAYHAGVGSSRTAKAQIKRIFGDTTLSFDTPKPVGLIEWILQIATQDDSVVPDSFAGSGTTAHAVLNQNHRDSGTRNFILAEMEDYADSLTAERVRRVIGGYAFSGTHKEVLLREKITWSQLRNADALLKKVQSFDNTDSQRFDTIKKEVKDGELIVTGEKKVAERTEGLGGSFTYCTLGKPLELDKLLTGETLPSFDALGAVLYHMATSEPFDSTKAHSISLDLDGHGYLGEAAGAHIWLIYQPNLEFLKSRDAALTLEKAKKMVELLPGKRHVVYAPARFVSQKMLRDLELPVEFAPLPFALYRMEVGQPA